MSIVDALNHALESVMAKMKHFKLFILFVAVIVFAFMVAVQSGESINGILGRNFALMGENTLRILSLATDGTDKYELKAEDVDFLKKDAGKNYNAVYGLIEREGEVKAGNQYSRAFIKGVTPDLPLFLRVSILQGGKFIDKNDMQGLRNVVVVSRSFAEKYYKKLDIVGETLSLKISEGKEEKFQIIGVMDGDRFFVSKPSREDYISEIYLPLTVATRFFGEPSLDYIEVSVKEGLEMDTVAGSTVKILEFKYGEGSVFTAKKRTDVINAEEEIISSAGILVLAMGLISILIGFVGIFSFMQLNIKARGEEIAVRKLLGASKNDIFLQLQMETLLLSGLGGGGGILLGTIFGAFQYMLFDVGSKLHSGAIFLSVMVTLMIGIVGGYFPSKEAAETDISPYMRRE